MPTSRPLRRLLPLALALAAAPAVAGEYSRTVFFGDSLTDSGHFRSLIPEQARPFTGKFTTNPALVWSEYVAGHYGTDATTAVEGGDNYAQGGARAGVSTITADSTLAQVNAFLAAEGGRADSAALYTVWTGANDIFAIAEGAPVDSTIATAVGGAVQAVGALDAAGARYILVPNLPDIGITPDAIAAGPMAQATLTALSAGYNDALYGALGQAGYRVIPLDTFNMLREIAASPAAYGLSNVTGVACQPPGSSSLTCNPTSYASPDAGQAYLFADGVHPTGVVHAMLGDYVLSVLEGPRLAAVIPYSATVTGRSRADQVAGHVDGRPEAAGLRWWGGLRADHQRYGHGDLYDGIAPAGLFGLDWSNGNGLVAGAFAGYGRMDADFGGDRGGFTQDEATLGGFIGWYGQRGWVNGQASYTYLDVDVDREVHIGPALRRHSGSTDGHATSVGLAAGYDFGDGALRHGPVASLLWQKIDLDGWSEGNTSSSALVLPDQSRDSLVGSLGWQLSYDTGGVNPYVRATWDREFEDGPSEVTARLATLPDMEYAVPGLRLDDDYGTVVVGARFDLFGLKADLGARSTVDRRGGSDAGLFLGLGGSF
ncbi:autotransporter domain-containing protein [Pseudoxanthomonas suwonensis]|uniref:autotransporter domain-containing protein n=1 Tax=Pseudoxanthomonas suwonensis TaxID=314722 RepID=UPI00138F9C92|nr:autotransporter domain-containing protein [Pseudoxanthomonas suwonensis]KAF1705672.1 autotransporter domain-containing esterase [Pseudoxanthomonas suwonensis]